MKIVFISNSSWYLYNFRFNLMKSLQVKGHSIYFFSPLDPYTKFLLNENFIFTNVKIDPSGTNPFKELLTISIFFKHLHNLKPNLVISYTPKVNLYCAINCLLLKINFLPGISGLGRLFIKKSFLTFLVALLYKFTFINSKKVFFENKDDLSLFIKYRIINKNQAIHVPGAGISILHYTSHFKYNVKRSKDDSFTFILISRILWDKGIGEYVNAAKIVKEKYPSINFKLLGFLDVANPSAISREQVDEWQFNGWIEYLGETDDVRPYIANSDCVVLPSYREGLPRTLLEAAILSKPIITTNVPGCRDTVIDEMSGFLCDVANSEDLAYKMMKIINLSALDRKNMGTIGRNYVINNFDEKIVITKYLDIISNL